MNIKENDYLQEECIDVEESFVPVHSVGQCTSDCMLFSRVGHLTQVDDFRVNHLSLI